jgi:hypothetical protein
MSTIDPYSFLICSFVSETKLAEAQRAVKNASAAFGFKCLRVDEIPHNKLIIEQIYDGIARASFVIADITGNRPNCYYEVGYADALKRPLIPIIRKGTRAHFDLGGRNLIQYENGENLQRLLKERILGTVLSSRGPLDDEDPHKGRFGRSAFVNGYLATGLMEIDLEGREYFKVHLTVRSINRRRPLSGWVTFHLHPTITPKKVRKVQSKNGVAECEFWSYGAFTVGVKVHKTETELELDLRDLPGSTDDFKAL